MSRLPEPVQEGGGSLAPRRLSNEQFEVVIRRAAELQARAGHASQAAMAIYQHATLDRDKLLADQIGATYQAWIEGRSTS